MGCAMQAPLLSGCFCPQSPVLETQEEFAGTVEVAEWREEVGFYSQTTTAPDPSQGTKISLETQPSVAGGQRKQDLELS